MSSMTFSSVTRTASPEETTAKKITQKSATQWHTGEVLIGFLVGQDVAPSRFGTMKLYTIAVSDEYGDLTGELVRLISSSDLEQQIKLVKPRQAVRIECQGLVGTSKRVRFSVQTAENFLAE